MPKLYRASVYGEVESRKRQLVRVKHPRYKIKQYRRTVTIRQQRRWDLKGTKLELRKAIELIKRRRAAPKVRHKSILTHTFLKSPDKWIDKRELEAPKAKSP